MVSASSPRVKSYSEYPYKQISNREIEKLNLPWLMRNELSDDMQEGSYVYNLDSKGQPGSHWVTFCLKHPNIYYVDSFGTNINGYPTQELREFGKRCGYKMIYANEHDIQHLDSWLCGWYACYFAKKMNKYFNQLNPKNFDTLIHAGYSKYPSDKNVNIITTWGKKMGIL